MVSIFDASADRVPFAVLDAELLSAASLELFEGCSLDVDHVESSHRHLVCVPLVHRELLTAVD